MAGEQLTRLGNFYDRVGEMQIPELSPRGIVADTESGRFFSRRADELLEICRINPDLHIISFVGDLVLNRFDPNARTYKLGDGDADPSLEFLIEPLSYADATFALEDALTIPVHKRTQIDQAAIFFLQAAVNGANLLEAKCVAELMKEFRERKPVN